MNRITADCLRCPFKASALRPGEALATLIAHIEHAHPDERFKLIVDANVVDEPKGQPS